MKPSQLPKIENRSLRDLGTEQLHPLHSVSLAVHTHVIKKCPIREPHVTSFTKGAFPSSAQRCVVLAVGTIQF